MQNVRVFRSSRLKWGGVAAVSSSFIVAGVLLAAVGDLVGWLAVMFFGFCGIVAILQLVRPATLTLTETTFTFDQLGRNWTRDFASCSDFEVWNNPYFGSKLVVFDHPEELAKKVSGVNKRFAGRSGALPDTFGMTAEELADTLNQARDKLRS